MCVTSDEAAETRRPSLIFARGTCSASLHHPHRTPSGQGRRFSRTTGMVFRVLLQGVIRVMLQGPLRVLLQEVLRELSHGVLSVSAATLFD